MQTLLLPSESDQHKIMKTDGEETVTCLDLVFLSILRNLNAGRQFLLHPKYIPSATL